MCKNVQAQWRSQGGGRRGHLPLPRPLGRGERRYFYTVISIRDEFYTGLCSSCGSGCQNLAPPPRKILATRLYRPMQQIARPLAHILVYLYSELVHLVKRYQRRDCCANFTLHEIQLFKSILSKYVDFPVILISGT